MHFHGADTGAAGEKEQVNWASETIGGPESPPLPFPPVCASVRATAPSKAGTGPAGPGTLQPRSATGDTGERGVCFPWAGRAVLLPAAWGKRGPPAFAPDRAGSTARRPK